MLQYVCLGYPDVDFSAVTSVESPDPQYKGINIPLDPPYSTIPCGKYTGATFVNIFFNSLILHSVDLS